MSYADGLLAPNERLVRRGRQHWFVLVWRARWAILAVIVGTLLLWIRANVSGDTPILDALGYLTLALFVFGLAVIARGTLRFRGEEYVITSRRVIHVEGVINKRATDASLDRINDAVLTVSGLGRIFGFGNLDVVTASGIGMERLQMLRDAKSFKKALIEAKHELEVDIARPTTPPLRPVEPAAVVALPPAPPAPTPTSPPPPPPVGSTPADVVAELDRLAARHAAGEISSEAFEASKRALLDRL
jgi:membrane protein YdbS with pleckstrin-like domain